MKPLPVFLGYDPKEHDAYSVAQFSILRRSSKKVLITPIYLDHLDRYLKRRPVLKDNKLWCPVSDAPMSTEFAISRFVVPSIQLQGWALYADCDIVCLGDVAQLFSLADPKYAVMVVKHEHKDGAPDKMAGQQQTYYKRKNWSSVVLWNCSHAGHLRLTRNRLEAWPGRDLHAFRWLTDDEIGSLPAEWNCLVGVGKIPEEPKILHYTLGGPWIEGWKSSPTDEIWLNELREIKRESVFREKDL